MYDVAIVGGGPAGSTAGCLLKKYNPDLKVIILEREKFPRDHIGESQLPPIVHILDEMGCWDKVEAANFPIKIGGTYRWGKSPELWDLEFIDHETYVNEPRPGKFEGQRKATAFQVDRSIYDEILLDHAQELGCEVREECKVVKIPTNKDRVEGFELQSGETIQARYYMDASGHAGIMRRALGIKTEIPTTLKNIAIWDYWQNADWAIEIGVGGTRIQVLSVGYGWLWFIPLGPTRTSVGIVVPAEYYKNCGMKRDELYAKAINEDERILGLMKNATSEGKLQATNDWSFKSERSVGENWFLIGESAGFADPIMSAGMSIAHMGAREAAYTILELDRGKIDSKWLKHEFERRQLQNIDTHIRFGDYWYSANEQFTELKEFTKKLAADSGLDLTPEASWKWLAQGGFISDRGNIGYGGFGLAQVHAIHEIMTDSTESVLAQNNVYKLNLAGATWRDLAQYEEGKVLRFGAYERSGKVLPLFGVTQMLVDHLQVSPKLADLLDRMNKLGMENKNDLAFIKRFILAVPEALEAMIIDGWVEPSYDPAAPLVTPPPMNSGIRWNTDSVRA
jgi:flavin-dependent dehydrogenase